uniref:hypothetical protein n=2 Tax=Vibrio TaxID=662 RepID=UPI001E3338B6
TITSVIYCYLTIRSFYFGFVPNIKNKKKVYISQINMLASAMVSIGLIGTFIGLVEMISSISGVLNNQSPGEINSMTDGIGSSLNGMSFAFLTSILGVGTSAYVIFSGFFIASNMDKATNTNISDCMNPDSIYE